MVFLVIGTILMVAGTVLFFVRRSQQAKAFSVKLARPATIADLQTMAQDVAQEIGGGHWRDYVKLSGTIDCDRPLTSELKQEPCVHYTMSVKREYEETIVTKDSNGSSRTSTQRGSETVSSNAQSVPFMLRDATGSIQVNPNNADIETVKILDEFRQELLQGTTLSFGKFSLPLGGWVGQPGRRTLGYRYCEAIVPIGRQALVVATVADQVNGLQLQKPAEARQKFIIALKTDEELTSTATQNARRALYGMVACWSIGAVLLVIGIFVK